MSEPDLITESGSEHLPLADRIGLMRAALLHAPFNGVTDMTRAATQAIHDLKLTIGWIRNTITLYENAIARGETDATLAKGAPRFVSVTECLILAWRRGGHLEFQRVIKEQRKRSS